MPVTRFTPLKLAIVFAFTLLTACSSTQVAYNNADWFITRVANSYLDLSNEQESAWSPTLQRVLQRHRDEELSHIVAFMINLEDLIEGGIDQSRLVCIQGHLDDLYRRTTRLVVVIASPLMVELSDPQIDHLAEKLQERQQDYAQKYLEGGSSQRLQRRVERVQDGTERWTGELNTEQRDLIRRSMMTWPDATRDWYEYRAEKQGQLIALVTERPSQEEMSRFLTRWWVEFSDRPAVLSQKHELLRQGIIRMLISLDKTLSDAQRTHLVGKIRDLRIDLQALLPDPLDDSRIASWGCQSLARL